MVPSSSTALSILHLNPHDHYGGAERLMNDLIAEQRLAGHRSLALVGHKTRADSPAIAFDLDPDRARAQELHRAGWPDYEFRGSHRLPAHPAVQNAEVIHAHNLYGSFFHPFSLIALSHARPLVWSIHDMQALTGYCSHSLDCDRWQRGCGDCPDLERPGPRLTFDNTAALWRDKQLISENSRLTIVGASNWIVRQIDRSLLQRHPVKLIPNGIDTNLFRPVDRAESRRRLGLPQDGLIIGSVAGGGVLARPWKGALHARALLETLRAEYPEMFFLNLGCAEPAAQTWIRSSAPESSERMREALGALDFFVHPSIADTAPLSVIEAMACGLPVVGFDLGGMPDLVSDDVGILVAEGDTRALTEAARKLAADANLRARLGAAARARAVAHFDRRRMAENYERLYREVIGTRGVARPATSAESSSALDEVQRVQAEMVAVGEALRAHRARRKTTDAEMSGLLDHPWLKLGLRLGVIRGAVKNGLRREAREREKRRAKEANQ